MVKRTGATNKSTQELVQTLKKTSHSESCGLWQRIASDLEKPTRQRRIVNLSRLNRHTKDNETVIVPGKVLGTGIMDHKVVVAAFSFSESAKKEIERAEGKAILIPELMQQNPKGKDVRIIG